MITTEEAKELDALVREVMLAAEEFSVVRATGFVPAGWRGEARCEDARKAYNAFVDKITNKDD